MMMVMMRAVAVCTLLLGSVQGASPCLAPTARLGSLSLRGGRPSQPPDVACLEERVDEWLLQWLKGIEAAVATPTTATKESTHAATPLGAIGAVRDSRGCLTSAGYAWCESAGACTPVWELCPSVGALISPTPAITTTGADAGATATAGAGGPLLGEVVDDFGCRASAGFRWCDSAAACTPSWQECARSPATTTATAATSAAGAGGGRPGRVVLQRAAKPTDMYKDADLAVKPGTPDTGAAPDDPNDGAGDAVPPPPRRRSLFGKATDMYKDAANAKADDGAGADHGPGGGAAAAAVVPRRLRAVALGKPTDQYKGVDVDAGVPANNAVAPARRLGLVSAAATAAKPADQYKDVAAAGLGGSGLPVRVRRLAAIKPTDLYKPAAPRA